LTNVVAVAAGWGFSLALRNDGSLWAWGGNGYGQLGIGTVGGTVATPVQIPGLSGIAEIAAGNDFAVAIQRDGAGHGFLWAWGNNDSGQLGDGATARRPSPVLVTGLSNVRHVRAGQDFVLVELADGTLATWGHNGYYELGLGQGPDALTPQPVSFLRSPAAMACGYNHALVVNGDGRVFGWGYNAWAFGEEASTWTPTVVTQLGTPVVLTAGADHTVFATQSGAVMALGTNGAAGTLGNGSTASSYVPVSVSGLHLTDNAWLASDEDEDGLSAWVEYTVGTDPLDADTNGNGLQDGVEAGAGGVPANQDSDGDGVSNALEARMGTDPFVADTDGDGANDSADEYPLDPGRFQFGPPDPNDHTPPVITLSEPTNAVPIP
jgi:alpha-tubulin suppressor-like RCC1 family protein